MIRLADSETHYFGNPELFLMSQSKMYERLAKMKESGDFSEFIDENDTEASLESCCASLVKKCFIDTLCEAMKNALWVGEGTPLRRQVEESIELLQSKERDDTANALLNEHMFMNAMSLGRGFVLTVNYFAHGQHADSITPIIRLDSFGYNDEGVPEIRKNFVEGRFSYKITSPFFPINRVGVTYSYECADLRVRVGLDDEYHIVISGECEGFGKPDHNDTGKE